MPRQFGPISRPPCARTSASSASCRAAPSGPTSAKPAEIDAERAHARRERVVRGGEHRASGHADEGEIDRRLDARERASLPGTSLDGLARAVDRNDGPAKCPASTLRKSSPPIVPRRADAPYTATLAGARNARSDAATPRDRDRRPGRRSRAVGSIGIVASITPAVARCSTAKPEPATTPSICWLPGRISKTSRSMPLLRRRARRAARAAACRRRRPAVSSATANATSGSRNRAGGRSSRARRRARSPPSPSTPISAPRALQSGSRYGSISSARGRSVA